MNFTTDDPRVRKIGAQTWIDTNSHFVFEAEAAGINAFNFRKGPGKQPPLTEEPYDTLDAAIAAHLGPREPAES
jgi:hypothetical protein